MVNPEYYSHICSNVNIVHALLQIIHTYIIDVDMFLYCQICEGHFLLDVKLEFCFLFIRIKTTTRMTAIVLLIFV